MDWVQMFLDFISSVAWPAVVALIILKFRNEIRAALAFLKSIEGPGGFKASFSQEVAAQEHRQEKLEATVVEASASLQATAELQATGVVEMEKPAPNFEDLERRVIDIAAVSPEQALLELRSQVHMILRRYGRLAGLTEIDTSSLGSAANTLIETPHDSPAPLKQGIGLSLKDFDENSRKLLSRPDAQDREFRSYLALSNGLPALLYQALLLLGTPVAVPQAPQAGS